MTSVDWPRWLWIAMCLAGAVALLWWLHRSARGQPHDTDFHSDFNDNNRRGRTR